jgi:hypothetical protein
LWTCSRIPTQLSTPSELVLIGDAKSRRLRATWTSWKVSLSTTRDIKHERPHQTCQRCLLGHAAFSLVLQIDRGWMSEFSKQTSKRIFYFGLHWACLKDNIPSLLDYWRSRGNSTYQWNKRLVQESDRRTTIPRQATDCESCLKRAAFEWLGWHNSLRCSLVRWQQFHFDWNGNRLQLLRC